MKSCYNLYFKRKWPYKKRHQKNIRGRAYNIFHKNRYKRWVQRANRLSRRILDDRYEGPDFNSVAEVLAYVKPTLDKAFLTLDEVSIQGVLKRGEAVERKEFMCRLVVLACFKLGLFKEKPDRYQAQYKILGYEPPVCTMLREPRPWQLPGWKSPWMMRAEWKKWCAQKEAQAA